MDERRDCLNDLQTALTMLDLLKRHRMCNRTTTRWSHRTWKKGFSSVSVEVHLPSSTHAGSACAPVRQQQQQQQKELVTSFFDLVSVEYYKSSSFPIDIKKKKKKKKNWSICGRVFILAFFACCAVDAPRGQRQSFSSGTLWTLAQLMSCNYVLIISGGHHSVHSSSPKWRHLENILVH